MKRFKVTELCPKCGKTHHIFTHASPSSHVKFAPCGQAYRMHGGPIEPANSLGLNRGVQIARALPVRDLTPTECRALLVHCHETYEDEINHKMRRNAYLFRGAGAHWHVYFNEFQRKEIELWMESEEPLTLASPSEG